MKRIIAFLLALVMTGFLVACGKQEEEPITMEPQVSQMKAICELATMDCYYHNVTKFKEEDASGWWIWTKDKHFWIEYSGVVTIGIDVSMVKIDINDTEISITLPEAKVLSVKVDSSSLTKDSYIVDKDSADITAEDETNAFSQAQAKMEETAKQDTVLLARGQDRAKILLEDYVNNIGEAMGVKYTIRWKYLGDESEAGNVTDQTTPDGTTNVE